MRKVLGAGFFNLVSLLSKDFVVFVMIAKVMAFVRAWLATRKWLQEFAYHIEVRWWVFLLAAAVATAKIALSQISK